MARTDLSNGHEKNTHVWIDVTVKEEREKSILVETHVGDVWLPRSSVGAHKKDGDAIVRLEVERKMAEKKGIA